MKLSTETKESLKRIIRDTIVLDPMISLRSLQTLLLKKGIKVGNLNYLGKLRKEITTDAVVEVDKQKVLERFTEVEERCRIMREQLWKVLFPDGKSGMMPSVSEQISAMRTIVQMDVKLIKAAIDIGLYTKKTAPGNKYTKEEELRMRNKPIPEEYKKSVIKAFKNWGIIPMDAEV